MNSAKSNLYPVTWSWRGLSFELCCDERQVAEYVGGVMALWNDPTSREAIAEPCRMEVIRREKELRFQGSQGLEGICENAAAVALAAESDSTLAVLNHPAQFNTVHAALVSRDNRGALILGPSGAGKSTLACGLHAAGYNLYGDDVALLESGADEAGLFAEALPRRISLRSASRALLGEAEWARLSALPLSDPTPEGFVFSPRIAAGHTLRKVAVTAVIFLQRLQAADCVHTAKKIHPAEALVSFCSYTNVAKSSGVGDCLGRLSGIFDHIDCYDLPRLPLSEMIESIDQILSPGGAES